MSNNKRSLNKRMLALTCGWTLALGQGWAFAVTRDGDEARPKINLFPTSVVESLSQTSRTARDMESDMYDVVARLEKQKQAYESTGCDNSDDQGCVQLRKAIRGSYKDMLEVMQDSIPDMRSSLDATVDSMGSSLRGELGRKMTPADVQRILGGRTGSVSGMNAAASTVSRQGKLSRMFSRYYELVRRGGKQADALPVLASQIYLDSMQSLYYLDLIEAEIGSQSTELVLELEWGELTDQITATVTDVKVLLWGEEDQSQEILEVGLGEASPEDEYQDLLVR
ncbi:hypothetical protein DWB85_07700 [Seongchinamella sediminis]|uniref:Uncharacterized protein n=1 Tax=Seongchinamella sediminis TaxID=2283635 RepID=A0A3L7E2C0_9GAMM|nr:hypothetical protein [Seongchinamella sediminis]RLQ22493.1 hypothetical protein DWB85_07700 [Seongchinamella sediminis]